jgi:dihydroneopterin aldolase
MDRIFIEGLRIETLIGIHAEERTARQPLSLSVWLDLHAADVAATDGIDDTVDYAAVVEALTTFVSARSDGLLETLAEACVAMLRRRFPKTRAVVLRIEKPVAAQKLGCESVGIEIRREFN